MSFRLWMIFYAFAELAAAMAVFGPLGILVALVVLGFWAYCWKYGFPRVVFFIVCLVLALILGVVMLLPTISSAREAARRSQCMGHLKQIAVAIQNYADVNGVLPPPYVMDATGKPMHSWRVLILPYMEETALYKKYIFNEPWNGPNNSKLANQMPDIYRCPSEYDSNDHSVETSYFLPVGPQTAFPGGVGIPFSKVQDGTSHTVSVIEATGLHHNWMDPNDISFDEAVELLTTKPRSGHNTVCEGIFTTTYLETSSRNIAFLDCHVTYMGQVRNDVFARAMLTCAGGEARVDRFDFFDDMDKQPVEPKSTVVIKWGRIWGLSVFVVLSLLPAAWMRRR